MVCMHVCNNCKILYFLVSTHASYARGICMYVCMYVCKILYKHAYVCVCMHASYTYGVYVCVIVYKCALLWICMHASYAHGMYVYMHV